ncbi:8-oxoguanine DNA glycosylase OGG fold protein [Streptomyces abyssomicinicus]|uniref:8-oxoguanine DNA glycosylase OGG fold protein n=1 Tax=Streptomyces abyssomicinicus TaxID=574929 RepID=UPI00124FB9AF|nr:hypothetical protein [Streptomyces abyssomicinicus]
MSDDKQRRANTLDKEMLAQGLPETALRAVERWLSGPGAPYAAGVDGHTITYTPSRWAAIAPWPTQLAERAGGQQNASISRGAVTDVFRTALADKAWTEALVASYVWGSRETGYYPSRLEEILRRPNLRSSLDSAAKELQADAPVQAYALLRNAVKGLGPAFYSKFLHFLGRAMEPRPRPYPLILDSVLAGVLREHATRVGLAAGMEWAPETAAWIWSKGGWTQHRYDVYLQWMHAAADTCVQAGLGTADTMPELLELAFFHHAWDPTTD